MVNINYGKLVDGKIQYAPVPLNIDGTETWTNDPTVFALQGYLPVVNTEEPVRDGYFYTFSWVEEDNQIKRVWVEHAVPEPSDDDEIPDSEALAIITGGEV